MKSGVILLNKPTGMTSNTAVKKVGKIVGEKKVGHLGTLDPMGAGLLPVLCGKATKLFDAVSDKTKAYRAVFKFGVETDTLDSDGKIINSIECDISENQIVEQLCGFLGEFEQMPPQFSAKKINGKKAYELARSGQEVELKPKKIKIEKIELIKKIKKNTFLFEVVCSEGTYIRSLCRDLSRKLSTCGIMCAITRTRCGAMQINNAASIQDIEKGEFCFLPAENLIDLPSVCIDKKFLEDLKNGRPIYLDIQNDGEFKLFCGNVFWGVAKCETGKICVLKNFYGGER